MDVVVVESPAKAKTINKYLGSDYRVLASYGHIRDLPSKEGSVQPEEDFRMTWSVDHGSEKHLKAIAHAAKNADRLYLATDPDREGEAISWHVREILAERNALKRVDVKRVVFHEITRSAVVNAIANPRELDSALIDAYLARRALDYLVGFGLSPVLWRKLPGSRSAGRVQSVALRLICEREAEIEIFKPREYWTVEAVFSTASGREIIARLTVLDGNKLDRYGIANEEAARAAVAEIERREYAVRSVERKTVKRRPAPPFTTSTLQQEASRKLRFGATRTMRTAQKLYEGVDIGGETTGLITYMRTDSVNLASEAIEAVRAAIARDFGRDYLPEQRVFHRNRAKNAQEAHEAIRPTDFSRKPADLANLLSRDERALYELIWIRAVASQMESATLEQVAVDIASPDGKIVLRATGSVVKFDGFMRLYQESSDERSDNEGGERILPPVSEGEAMTRGAVNPEQHFTKPPPRYTEASLVRKLEELGIGRPSTYASILQVLQDRNYVTLESRRFAPNDLGRMVTAFLTEYFLRYVEYDFTADLENSLDAVSNGNMEWRTLLREFWTAFSEAVGKTQELRVSEVIERLDSELGAHFFPAGEDGSDLRRCPACGDGRLGLKLSRSGGFIGCSRYPDCRYTTELRVQTGEAAATTNTQELGRDPETGLPVTLRKGPYGFYVQLGEAEKRKEKPRRVSLKPEMAPADLDLETALALLSLPREIGRDPETGNMILAGIGRYGPYLRTWDRYVSLAPGDDVLTIGLNRAVTVIAEAGQNTKKQGKTIGNHPEDGRPVELLDGRYGPYVRHGRTNASLPRGSDPDSLSFEQALELLAARKAKAGAKGKPRKTGKRARGKT